MVDGPGASLLSINANGASQVFVHSVLSAALSGLTITGGSARYGGGLYNMGGMLSVTDCIITGNSALSFGGGVANGGKLSLAGCVITGNYCGDYGGGLDNNSIGTLSLSDCTVSGNTAHVGGGGLANDASTISLTNCTISGNTADQLGGAVFTGEGTATLTNCTVSGNTTTVGFDGGFAVYYRGSGNGLVLTNTIVAGNNGGDVAGSVTGGTNLIGGNPLVSPLGDYGGPTPTMALLPGSPAIGGGTSTGAPALDQRGEPRAGHVDIGAFQSQGFILQTVAGGSPQSAAVNTAFAMPLTVRLTALNPVEPVDGGVVSFAVTPSGGASATLSAATATIAGGMASVSATANGTAGSYSASATASGAGPVGFALTNTEVAQPGADDRPRRGGPRR